MCMKANEIGPIQFEDKLLLSAVLRMTVPTMCVELGFLKGESAGLILESIPATSRLISYDTNPIGSIDDDRFTLKIQDQSTCNEQDIDFIFFDASHDLEQNITTFKNIESNLNEGCIIAIHDTGLWNKKVFDTNGYYIGDEYAHQPDERKFVNWIKQYNSEFQIINLHTTKETRHGVTLIQKYKQLTI